MPQLDLATYISQIFWLLCSFISLWIISHKIIIPKISSVVEARKRKYNDAVYRVNKLNNQAKQSYEEYERLLDVANANLNRDIQAMQNNIEMYLQNKEVELDNLLDNKISICKESVKENKKIVLQNSDKAIDVFVNISLHLLGAEFLLNKNTSIDKDYSNGKN